MSKLAVIFPGIGYTAEKPLLYYSQRIAKEKGYEILVIAYGGFPKKVKGDRKKMVESFQLALSQSEEKLKETDLASYEDVLFIGKSVGTIVAAKIASESPVKEKIRLILYTPLEDTFSFSFGSAIAFTGTADPWVGGEKSRIAAICGEKKIPCMMVPEANHSLESPEILGDLKELYRIMKETERYIVEGV